MSSLYIVCVCMSVLQQLIQRSFFIHMHFRVDSLLMRVRIWIFPMFTTNFVWTGESLKFIHSRQQRWQSMLQYITLSGECCFVHVQIVLMHNCTHGNESGSLHSWFTSNRNFEFPTQKPKLNHSDLCVCGSSVKLTYAWQLKRGLIFFGFWAGNFGLLAFFRPSVISRAIDRLIAWNFDM